MLWSEWNGLEMNDPLTLTFHPQKDLGMTGLYAADWLDLIKRMETDDALFQRFHR